MKNKKIVVLTILLFSLFAFSAVSAADNQTEDIVSAEPVTIDVVSSDTLNSEDMSFNYDKSNYSQNVLSDSQSDEVSLVENDDEVLSYYYTYPYYYSYDVKVYDTSIDYGDSGSITMYINSASSDYDYKYYFYLRVYDSDDNQKISQTYYSSYSSSSLTYYLSSDQLSPGNYTIEIVNYYDDQLMDTATLSIVPPSDDSYYVLNNIISNADSGSTVYLDKDYLFDSSFSGIDIPKELTIDGKGHSIDGGNLARIFKVNANDVTLKNIVFKNCMFNNGYSSRGGAVYWSGSDGILENCEFINCSIKAYSSSSTSYSYAGAVYWSGSNGKINNCSFINCKSDSQSSGSNSYAYAGAVNWAAEDGVIDKCNFINCIANSYSSAYSSYSKYNADAYGGAIYWNARGGVVSNSRFSQCYAKFYSEYSSSNSESRGAAIYWDGSYGLVNNSYFMSNSETEKGVIYVSGDYFNVISSAFLDNYKNDIYWVGFDGSVNNSIFISTSSYYPIYSSNYQVSADYNWWGNIIDDYNVKKVSSSNVNINNWLYLDITVNSPLEVGETGKIKFNLNNLVSEGIVSKYSASKLPDIEVNIKSDDNIEKSTIIKKGNGEITYTATSTPYDLVDVSVNKIKKQLNLTVVKGNSKIIAANVKTVYNGGKYLKIILNDKYGHIIKDANVTVKLNGKTKKYITDNNGEIKISTNYLTPKTYAAKMSFAGNENYYKSSATSKIVVKKATPKLTFSKQTFYNNVKKKSVTVTLKDNAGVVKNVKLKLIVNGKTFTAKTNSNGVATFKVTNLGKIGTYKATVKFAGNAKYKAVSKKSSIVVKKSPKYKIITIKTKMSDSGEKITKNFDNYVIQTEKFQHALTTLCVFVYKDGNMLNRKDYLARFQYKENGKWTWTKWSHGTQAAVYYKIADSISNDIAVGNVQVKLKV